MENRETKFKELMDEFDSLLSKYKDVCVRLRKMESCGAPDEEQGELAEEKYILELQLIKLVCRLDDLSPGSLVGLCGGIVAGFKYVIDHLEADGEPRALGEERSKYEK